VKQKRIALAVVVAVAAAVSAAQRPTGPARLGKIAFSTNRTGEWRVWAMGEDGSGAKELVPGEKGAADVDPCLSPDGKSVLFTSTRGGKAGVWRMARPGGKPQRICDGDQAEWSPDGLAIALRRAGRIYTRVLASGKETAVTPKDLPLCSGPAWSPDGKRIAFASRQGDRNAIYLVPAAGGPAVKLHDKKGACEPHFSPDGKRIVYETETHVCTIGVDGKGNRMATWFGGLQRYPRFSPDGKRIVFCQAPSPTGPWEIYTIPAAGGTPRRLTEGASDMYPHWR